MLVNKLIFTGFLLILNGVFSEKLPVTILFETLGQDSFNFIDKQLYPVVRELGRYLDIDYIPYGNSQSFYDGAEFKCAHGTRECFGNRVLSCGLHFNQMPKEEYVHCFIKKFNEDQSPEQLGQTCISPLDAPWPRMETCFNGTLGTQLQLVAEKATKSVNPPSFPAVLFNNTYRPWVHNESLSDFRKVVCYILRESQPNACVQDVRPVRW